MSSGDVSVYGALCARLCALVAHADDGARRAAERALTCPGWCGVFRLCHVLSWLLVAGSLGPPLLVQATDLAPCLTGVTELGAASSVHLRTSEAVAGIEPA